MAFIKGLPRHDVLDLSCLQGVENFALWRSLLQLVDKHDWCRRDFISARNEDANAELQECKSRHIEVRKTLARVGKQLELGSFCLQPLQLGFSDYFEWKRSEDHCRICAKKSILDDLLQHPCSCGLMSFDFYKKAGITPVIDSRYFNGIFVHQIKELVCQRFFTSNLVATGFGTIPEKIDALNTQELAADFIEIESFNRVLGKTKESLYHHICLIVGENLFQQIDFEESRIDQLLDEISLASICAAGGELHVCKGFAGISDAILRFAGSLRLTGRVCIFVGEYIGAEEYCIRILNTRKYDSVNASACQLLGLHDNGTQSDEKNFLLGFTEREFNDVMNQDSKSCTPEQRRYFESVGSSRVCFCCKQNGFWSFENNNCKDSYENRETSLQPQAETGVCCSQPQAAGWVCEIV